jgi:putative hemolysin
MSASLLKSNQIGTRKQFVVHVAQNTHEVNECLKLRYHVFAKELKARLHNTQAGLDDDQFDQYCRHVFVRDNISGEIIATTRVLDNTGAEKIGYFYSETEFNLSAIHDKNRQLLEIGRTCIHPDYRGGAILAILWNGLAKMAVEENIDYLIGCASISLEKGDRYVQSVLNKIKQSLAPSDMRVQPLIPLPKRERIEKPDTKVQLPTLLKGYIRMGGTIGGEPYWDAAFNVADVFVMVETQNLNSRYIKHFINRV